MFFLMSTLLFPHDSTLYSCALLFFKYLLISIPYMIAIRYFLTDGHSLKKINHWQLKIDIRFLEILNEWVAY